MPFPIAERFNPTTRYSLVLLRTGATKPHVEDAGTLAADAYSFVQYALAALEARNFVVCRLWDTWTWIAWHSGKQVELRVSLIAETIQIAN
jgi:hypothetical protein